MKPYEAMAIVYDALIEDVDYSSWYGHIKKQLKALSVKPYKVLEIGAGTGNMTQQFVLDGCQVTALEPSEAMLSLLQEKMMAIGQLGKIRFFQGFLSAFSTKETFDACFATLDVFNYLSPSELDSTFKSLSILLNPQGVLAFDISTPYKLSQILGDAIFAENHDEFAFIWENHYDAKKQCLLFDFALFSECEDNLFERHIEHHCQYAHTKESILKAASAYFECISIFGDLHGPIQETTQRFHFYMRKR
jgi:SAM-dependent methyltransferase